MIDLVVDDCGCYNVIRYCSIYYDDGWKMMSDEVMNE